MVSSGCCMRKHRVHPLLRSSNKGRQSLPFSFLAFVVGNNREGNPFSFFIYFFLFRKGEIIIFYLIIKGHRFSSKHMRTVSYFVIVVH